MAVTINGTTGIDTPSLTADTTTLVVDETNNRVGIGTASPTKPLHIYGNSENNHQIRLQNDFGSGADWTLNAYGANGNFYVGNNLDRLVIDSAGRVTMPYQPLARAACSSTITSVAKIPLNAHNLSNGGLSIDNTNNRMIVPVDGYYVVGFSHLVELANSNVAIRHNGSDISNGRSQSVDGANNEMSTHTIVNLSANDYIEFWVVAGRIHNNASYNSMYCYLLG